MDPDEGPRYVVHIDVDVVNESAELLESIQGDEATDYLADLNEMLQSKFHSGAGGNGEAVMEDEEALDYLNEILARGDDCDFGNPHAQSSSPGVAGFLGEPHSFDEAAAEEGTLSSKLEATPTSFDLCPECYAKYTQDPLSRDRAFKMHFSNN